MKINKIIAHIIEVPINRKGGIEKYLRINEDTWYMQYGYDYSVPPYSIVSLEKEFKSIMDVMHEQLELFPCEL